MPESCSWKVKHEEQSIIEQQYRIQKIVTKSNPVPTTLSSSLSLPQPTQSKQLEVLSINHMVQIKSELMLQVMVSFQGRPCRQPQMISFDRLKQINARMLLTYLNRIARSICKDK